jgi:HEAT repeat protein
LPRLADRLLALALWSAALSPALAQEPPAPTAAELLEREKVRAEFDATMAYLRTDEKEVPERGKFYVASERLAALGPAAAPFLADEIARKDVYTYNIVTYVLGRVKAPDSAEILRKAIAEDDQDDGNFAAARKQWAAYGLALAGDPAAVDLVTTGTHDVAWAEFMEGARLLEVTALVTAPASVPILVSQLERFSKDEANESKLDFALSALGRMGDPANVAHVAPYLTHRRSKARAAAATALGRLGDPSVAPKLLAALDDPILHVRAAASMALVELKPKDHMAAILARLETETEHATRADLYRTLGHIGGDGVLDAFRSYAARGRSLEKLGLADALGILRSPKGLNLLREMLRDRDLGVVSRAVSSIEVIGGGGATDTLLALLADSRPAVRQMAIEALERMREPRAAPRIADLLLKQEIQAPIADIRALVRLQKMGDALVRFRYAEPLPQIKEAARLQTEPQIVAYLAGLVKQLEVIAENRDSVPAWIAAAGSPDRTIRTLAFGRLAELRTPEAVRALAGAFERADLEDGVEILRSIGRSRSAEGARVVEQVLVSPVYDAHERLDQRRMAAWAAREIGGEPMVAALRRSAERREGQEIETLEYLAVLDGKGALPTLRAVRVPRLSYFEWDRGLEIDRLNWLIRELSAGRPIDVVLDRPPERIALR